MKNIILIGPPGAGKGTQAKMIAENLGLIHISTGDLIREEQKNDTKIGKLATQMIDKGHYLPDAAVIQMVKQKIIDNPKAEGFIFDGFPRTVDQAKALDDFMNHRKTPINKIIQLDVPNDVIIKRITERSTIENRPDDAPEVIATRIDTYNKQTVPVINYFKEGYLFAGGRGVEKIDGTKAKEEILTDITTILS